MSQWTDLNSTGKVLYDFNANGQFQISLTAGETVEVVKMSSGWYKGKVVGRDAKGIFPVSFIQLIPNSTPSGNPPTASPTPAPASSVTQANTPQVQTQASAPEAANTPVSTNTYNNTSATAASNNVANTSSNNVSGNVARKWPVVGSSSNNANNSNNVNNVVSSTPFNRPPSNNTQINGAAPAANAHSPTASGSSSPTGTPSSPVAPVRRWPPVLNSSNSNSNLVGTNPPAQATPSTHPPLTSNNSSTNSNNSSSPPPANRELAPNLAATIMAKGPPPLPPPSRVQQTNPSKEDEKEKEPANYLPSHRFSLNEENAPNNTNSIKKSPQVDAALISTMSPTFLTSTSIKNDSGGDHVSDDTSSSLADSMSLDALVREIALTCREWSHGLKTTLIAGNHLEYHRGMERMSALMELRRRVMSETISETERGTIRHEIIQLIESSRKMVEGYMVPRNAQGQLADTSNTGVIELLRLHRVMYSTLKEESSSLWMQKAADRRLVSLKKQAKQTGGMVASGLSAPLPTPMLGNASIGVSTANLNNLPSASVAASSFKRVTWPSGPLHLYMDIKMCIFSVGEATDIHFSLYSAVDKKFITEDYSLALTEQGMPVNLSLLNKMRAVFADLDEKDMDKDLYLVVRIFRKGRLVFDPKKPKAPSKLYRRPFGCAATQLSALSLEQNVGKEVTPPISSLTIYVPSNEADFPKCHELIIARDKSLTEAPRAKGIAMSLILFSGDLNNLRKANTAPNNLLSPDDTPSCNKLYFPEVMNPGDTRNDFYVHLLNGSFAQDSKKSAKNIEVTVRVVNDKGDNIENAIQDGSGATPVTEWSTSVYYHLNTPAFDELIRLSINPDIFERCHLLFTFWHVSTSAKKSAPFAFSYLPLSAESGAVIADDEYDLPTYKPYPKLENGHNSNAFYLRGPELSNPKLVNRKEHFLVRTILCSTKKTQNPILHQLFKWKFLDVFALKNTLDGFISINKEGLNELSKFVREIFDVFFAILSSDKHTLAHESVFKSILHILSLLTDKKLAQYRPLVDSYITNIFRDSTVHRPLVNLCTLGLQHAAKAPSADLMRLTKCLNYVFKFIIASRQLDMASPTPTISASAFKSQVSSMLSYVNGIVSATENVSSSEQYLLPSQSYLVRSFPDSIADLENIFDASELGAIARDLILAIPNVPSQNLNRLNLIRNLLTGEIGSSPASRDILFPVIIDALRVHLVHIDSGSLNEPYLCISILASMLDIIQSNNTGVNDDRNQMWQFHSLLHDLVHVVEVIIAATNGEITLKQPSDTVLASCKVDIVVDSITCLWTLLYSFTDNQIDRIVSGLTDRTTLDKFLDSILNVCRQAMDLLLYPDMWIVMNMLQLSVIAKVLHRVSSPIRDRCQTVTDNTYNIWRRYFDLCIAMLRNEALLLEHFTSKRKLQFVTQRYGDIRNNIISECRDMWLALGNRKCEFTEVLVSKLFDLAGNTSGESQKLGLDIYFDMIQHEYLQSSTSGTEDRFNLVERHTIDALYNLANLSQETGSRFMKLIYSSMTSKLTSNTSSTPVSPDFKKACNEFLEHISRMYSLMASLLRFPDTALFEDERTSVALKLMQYLETSGHVRKEMYTRYAQYLVDLHLGLKNFVEAGMTQIHQIAMLEWSDNLMAPLHSTLTDYPQERERERKEKMYRSAIRAFTAGEDLERAIFFSDQLRDYYTYDSYDYDKLAQLLQEQAEYYKRIVGGERFYCNYFRVVYYGEGFDDELRDKEFVYRGVKLEPVMDFTNRIKRKWPEAKIFMSSDKPTDELLKTEKQVISITTLTRPSDSERQELALWREKRIKSGEVPVSPSHSCALGLLSSSFDRDRAKRAARFIPSAVSKYRDNNSLNCFIYSKGIQKSTEKKPLNEFKHLWVAKTVIFIDDPFPTNRRRCNVVDKKEVLLSPIENAVQAITGKTLELKIQIEMVNAAPPGPVDVGPLSMLLNGMIDAAVNGGTQKYIEAFLGIDFLNENGNDNNAVENQRLLKEGLADQIALLKIGLECFGRRCDEKLKGLFTHLSGFYEQMQAKTKQVLN